jgi:sugar lactone lactonase YvrE
MKMNLQSVVFALGLAFLMGLSACSSSDTVDPSDIIPLPDGFQPEGIAISGTKLYTGSIPTGRIFRADITTRQAKVLVDAGAAGRSAIGMKVDGRGRLFVAGGQKGKAYVYDAETGDDITLYTLATGTTFINDVIVTPNAAWFTDSSNPFLYKVPINADGSLGSPSSVSALSLSGDMKFIAGQFNSNGIAATPDGATLIIVQSNTGKLFTVNPATGATKEIILRTTDNKPDNVVNGDGILLQDQTLFVVQNQQNSIAKITLSADFSAGIVAGRVSSPGFDVPTTVAASDGSLYLVNARFGVDNPDTAAYSVVRIDKPSQAVGGGNLVDSRVRHNHDRPRRGLFRAKRHADLRHFFILAFRSVPCRRHTSFGPGRHSHRHDCCVGDMAAASIDKKERSRCQTGRGPAVKMACRSRPAGHLRTSFPKLLPFRRRHGHRRCYGRCHGEVIAECSTGFGASCFWHPVKARTAATAETAMIAVIFFMLFHPQSPHKIHRSALISIGINWIKNALQP